ncbi:PDZ domain-containing protein [Caloranaerobacter sp. DY30410]|uniref:PDZ domain-containing protein n=1 Tax=Caloranaerobacter sp. DY30410 TaxID=3238305 RepID=UPI003CFCB2D2
MIKILEILYLLVLTLLQVFLNPVYWGIIILLYFQYKKIGKMEKKILGINKKSNLMRIFSSMVNGTLGGILGSLIIILLGVTIQANDFKYIFLLAVVLMLIHPRFICFSYAGGIISLSYLIFGYPKVNVSSIMAIVGILHLIESFLILVDGDSTKIPIYIERDQKIVGGFNMMRFWPIPFIVLLTVGGTISSDGVNMPNWWPLFRPENILFNTDNITYVMMGVIAALGYGDMAVSDYPENKVKESARNLSIYSILLIILSVISTYVYAFKYIAALFGPLAHEGLIQLGRAKEKRGKPKFECPEFGVKILDVMPNEIAEKIGLKSGDIIISVNGNPVNSKDEIQYVLLSYPAYIWIEYIDRNGEYHTKEYMDYNYGVRKLGILTIPRYSTYSFVVKEIESPLMKLRKKFIDK